MKCPKCGAQLQEKAQFCFYCMHVLTEKKKISSNKSSRRKWLLIATSVVILMITVGLLIAAFSLGTNKNYLHEDDKVISTFEDFQLRATYLTGKNGLSDLWNPDGFVNTHGGFDTDGDQWLIYSTDVYIDNANLRMHFCEDGVNIIAALTGLTDETMESGLRLIECSVSSVYNYTFTNLNDMLTDRSKYPMKAIPAYQQVLVLAEQPDPAGEMQDAGTEAEYAVVSVAVDINGAEDRYMMYIQMRTRVYEGKTYYDIFLLHVLDDET